MNRLINDCTITLTTGTRDKERKLQVIATLPGGEQFDSYVWIQDRLERKAFLDRLCMQYPGLGTEERLRLRDELARIAKENDLDIDVHPPHGKVNGRATTSIDFHIGSKLAFNDSGNLFDSRKRRMWAERIAELAAGKGKDAKRKFDAMVRRVDDMLLEKAKHVRLIAEAPPQQPTFVPEECPYEMRPDLGILYRRRGHAHKQLTNFVARIVANIVRTDGLEQQRDIEIEAALAGRPPRRFMIRCNEFEEMKWPLRELGGLATFDAEVEGAKNHARAAIQKLSSDTAEKTVYTHTGWRQCEGKWVYLHAGGMVSAEALPEALAVSLGEALDAYELPPPPAEPQWQRRCIHASLRMLKLAKPEIVFPVYCAIWRSVLGDCDLSVFLNGRTQSFKSELASLAQRHFGARMHAKALPGSWESTLNHLRDMAFRCMHALFTVDDFKPGVLKARDAAMMHKMADQLLRAQGNNSGRGRCDEYGNGRPTKRPRGMILATGEEVPFGQSLRARMVIVDMLPRDMSEPILTECQKHARDGEYATAMAGFLRWLAADGRIGSIMSGVRDEIEGLRPLATEALKVMNLAGDDLRRTTDNISSLLIGFRYFLQFAIDAGALTADQATALRDECWAGLVRCAELQAKHQRDQDPVARFLQLLRSALSSGQAFISAADGSEPGDVRNVACGYRRRGLIAWEPGRTRIGFYTPECLCLDIEASFRVANEVVGPNGDGIGVSSPAALGKQLDAKGLLVKRQVDARGRRTERRRVGGEIRMVWNIPHDALDVPGETGGGVFSAHARTEEGDAPESFDFHGETRGEA